MTDYLYVKLCQRVVMNYGLPICQVVSEATDPYRSTRYYRRECYLV